MDRVEEFYNAVYNFLPVGRENLIDCCSGDGRAGIRFKDGFQRIIFTDVKDLRSFRRNAKDLDVPFELDLGGIDKLEIPNSSLIIAVHACGMLTDKILEKAVSSRSPVIVMPCCYNSRMKKYLLLNKPDGRKLVYDSEKDYYDAFRLQYLRENEFSAYLARINPRTTPMNNILIGLPN